MVYFTYQRNMPDDPFCAPVDRTLDPTRRANCQVTSWSCVDLSQRSPRRTFVGLRCPPSPTESMLLIDIRRSCLQDLPETCDLCLKKRNTASLIIACLPLSNKLKILHSLIKNHCVCRIQHSGLIQDSFMKNTPKTEKCLIIQTKRTTILNRKSKDSV